MLVTRVIWRDMPGEPVILLVLSVDGVLTAYPPRRIHAHSSRHVFPAWAKPSF